MKKSFTHQNKNYEAVVIRTEDERKIHIIDAKTGEQYPLFCHHVDDITDANQDSTLDLSDETMMDVVIGEFTRLIDEGRLKA